MEKLLTVGYVKLRPIRSIDYEIITDIKTCMLIYAESVSAFDRG